MTQIFLKKWKTSKRTPQGSKRMQKTCKIKQETSIWKRQTSDKWQDVTN